MQVTIQLDEKELKEAVMCYLREHRDELIDPSYDEDDAPEPFIIFTNDGKPVGALQANVIQNVAVHDGDHPYR